MTQKSKILGKGLVKASAKIEATARASFERKKMITEIVPPDVTRAKVNSWLDLISPLTEWAGLRGDELRYRRQQLRIQQDQTLNLVAQTLSEKMTGKRLLGPVPLKFLVPALEKASLENPSDDYMIEKWADLLLSSATQPNVSPRFVGILSELTSSQAKLLEDIFFKDDELERSHLINDWLICELDQTFLKKIFLTRLSIIEPNKVWDELRPMFQNPGLTLLQYMERLAEPGEQRPVARKYFQMSEKRSLDFDVLRSLSLIDLKHFYYASNDREYDLDYYQITDAGLSFLSVCSPRARDVLALLKADKSGRFFASSNRE